MIAGARLDAPVSYDTWRLHQVAPLQYTFSVECGSMGNKGRVEFSTQYDATARRTLLTDGDTSTGHIPYVWRAGTRTATNSKCAFYCPKKLSANSAKYASTYTSAPKKYKRPAPASIGPNGTLEPNWTSSSPTASPASS